MRGEQIEKQVGKEALVECEEQEENQGTRDMEVKRGENGKTLREREGDEKTLRLLFLRKTIERNEEVKKSEEA